MAKYEILKKITDATGISGDERGIRNAIISELDPNFHEIIVDRVGNLIVRNHGKGNGKNIIVDAHMDDVGAQVTGFSNDGKVYFHPVGGIDTFTLVGKSALIGDNLVEGIFCTNTIVKSVPISHTDMFIEIGCESKQEAEAICEVGDAINFESDYVEFGDGFLKSRNFDDRVGCTIMVDLLKEKLDIEYTASFTVREEVGLFGGKVSAYTLEPDIAICLEGGGCADIPGFDEDDKVMILNEGPALSVKNMYSAFDPDCNKKAIEIAKKYDIPIQSRRGNAGGCNGQAMQQIKKGARTITLAPPNRYLHTHNSVISENDYISNRNLVRALLTELSKEAQ